MQEVSPPDQSLDKHSTYLGQGSVRRGACQGFVEIVYSSAACQRLADIGLGSSPGASASNRSCCVHGSSAMGFFARCALPAAFACTARRTPIGERMRRGLHQGLSAAEAAQAALATTSSPGRPLEDAGALLLGAIESYDESQASGHSGRRAGCVWAKGIRAPMLSSCLRSTALEPQMGTGPDQGQPRAFRKQPRRGRLSRSPASGGAAAGPLALLACAPGEQHGHQPARLWAHSALLRVAHPLPRRRYPARDHPGRREDDRARGDRPRHLRHLLGRNQEGPPCGGWHGSPRCS